MMDVQMKEYANRLKLSWIPRNYQMVKADTMQEFLLKLFEQEVQQRELILNGFSVAPSRHDSQLGSQLKES